MIEISRTLHEAIARNVDEALAEDVGKGDLTADLIAADEQADAVILAREEMTLAGRPWVDEVYRQIDSRIRLQWQAEDGESIEADSVICTLHGPARALLTGERTALNFLQSLSATATTTARYVAAIGDSQANILDTRKTVPGLRLAQKYAVRCGGGVNHRIGLFDAILIKENHIMSAGGIERATSAARALHAGMPVEVEVEDLDEMRQALQAKAERLLLDNFSQSLLKEAVALNQAEGSPPARLEASGDITIDNIGEVAATGVDFISIGALTKNIAAIDLSMRFENE